MLLMLYQSNQVLKYSQFIGEMGPSSIQNEKTGHLPQGISVSASVGRRLATFLIAL